MHILGIDIGGTKCSAVLGRASVDGEPPVIVDKIKIKTGSARPWQTVLDELAGAADALLSAHGVKKDRSELEGIGISCGGPLDSARGVILSPPNLPGWDEVPAVEYFESRFGVGTRLQNDANACAVAEWKYGAAKGSENAVFLTFGTGMGAGLILGGRLYSGTRDLAGEVGHLRLTDSGPFGYGKSGSFEGWCSGGGLVNIAKITAGSKAWDSPLARDLSLVDGKTLQDALEADDPFARAVYTACAEKLGMGLSVIIDILDPEVIVIGSIYTRMSGFFDGIIKDIVERETLPPYKCKIKSAQLGESIGDIAALSLAAGGY